MYIACYLQVEEHVREGESDRYAVVYCGATDAVGLSLRETCTKLGVQFSWESFGSW
jgi:ornithine carbamoyltransferase